jgi:hypothetical protein
MRIITTREFREKQKNYFELAETERVAVKRGTKYVNLVVTDKPDARFFFEDWMKEFMSIPLQYRCNPFEVSPSGDLFYADKRNIEHLNKSIEQARSGQIKKLSKAEQSKLLTLD